MREWFAKYKKLWWAIGATVAAVLVALTDPISANGVLLDDGITIAEWHIILPMVAGAILVGFSPDVPGARYVKMIASAIPALLAAYPAAALSDGISSNELAMLTAHLLGFIGMNNANNVGDYYDRARDAKLTKLYGAKPTP